MRLYKSDKKTSHNLPRKKIITKFMNFLHQSYWVYESKGEVGPPILLFPSES